MMRPKLTNTQVQLLAGKLPSEKLVEQYHLEQYVPLIQAMKRGDLALFDATMENKQFQFIQEVHQVVWSPKNGSRLVSRETHSNLLFQLFQGSYLLLQKLRQSVYRRLLKQVVTPLIIPSSGLCGHGCSRLPFYGCYS